MEDGHHGCLIMAVVGHVGVVPKPGQEFATTRGPKTEVHVASVLPGKLQGVTVKFAVSFNFANYYLLAIKLVDLVIHIFSPYLIVLHSYEWRMVRVGRI